MRAIHPGEVLREDFIVTLGMSVHALAKELGVPATRINEMVNDWKRVITDIFRSLWRILRGRGRGHNERGESGQRLKLSSKPHCHLVDVPGTICVLME